MNPFEIVLYGLFGLLGVVFVIGGGIILPIIQFFEERGHDRRKSARGPADEAEKRELVHQ